MRNNSFVNNQILDFHSRRQIFISSLGKKNKKLISCHIDQQNKQIKFQQKQSNAWSILKQIFLKYQRVAFNTILRFNSLKKNEQETVFLPEALLNNNCKILQSFKQKLLTGHIDRYISLHLPLKVQKSRTIQKSISASDKVYEEIDSTCIDNKYHTVRSFNSFETSKIKRNDKGSKIEIIQIPTTSLKRKSRCKNNILNISYTQIRASSDSKSIKNYNKSRQLPHSGQYTIQQFTLSDFNNNNTRMEQKTKKKTYKEIPKVNRPQIFNYFETTAVTKQFSSPYIGKNRKNSANIKNLSFAKQFTNINIGEQYFKNNSQQTTLNE